MTAAKTSAVVLFGHGSRDPLWRKPIEAVATRIRSAQPETPVLCAYLELTEPDLPTTVAALVDDGARSIRIVPMFLGTGRHAREDLPALVDGMRARYPAVMFDLRIAVGEDPRLLALLADIAVDPAAG